MQKLVNVFLICLIMMSCESRKKEYYDNGLIKADYVLKDNEIEGVLKEYYESGGLKEVHRYSRGKRTDSSIYYYEEPKDIINKIKYYYTHDTIRVSEYFPNSVIQRKGLVLSNGNRVGKWSLYRQDGTLSEVLEYINLGGKEYLNQGWHFNKKGDTIIGKGNYLEFIFSNDTVGVYEPVKILVNLKEPLLSYDSNVFVCIPKGSLEDVGYNFSNIDKVEWDTLPSIKDEKIIDNYQKYNLQVSFGLEFNKPGVKHIRGFLSESNVIDKSKRNKGSFDMKERKIYFDKTIFVRDNLKSN